jgi:hypothetical protein
MSTGERNYSPERTEISLFATASRSAPVLAYRPLIRVIYYYYYYYYSVALVCERTIPKDRPPLVSEVSANLCGYKMPIFFNSAFVPSS